LWDLIKTFGIKPTNIFYEKKYAIKKADYIELRGDKYLLIWRDIPFWMVVDSELYEFINLLDGMRTVNSIICCELRWKSNKKQIIKCLNNNVITFNNTTEKINDYRKNQFIPIQNIALNITSSCNLHCPMCYNSNSNNRDDEISAELMIELLKKIRAFSYKKATLTILGGEPLLVSQKLKKVCEAAVDMGLSVIVSTNGTYIDDEFIILAKKLKLEVQISLDGHNAYLNDMIRGAGMFDKVMQNIDKLVKNDVYTILSLVCHRGNLHFLNDYYNLAFSLGVNEARFIPLKRLGSGDSGKLEPVGMQEIIENVTSMLHKNPKIKKLMGRDCYSILADTCRYSTKRQSCGTGLETLLIDSNGEIYPCINMANPEFKIADIKDDKFDFEKSWLHSAFIKEYRKQTSIENKNSACYNCPVKYWCLGVCRGETYHLSKKLNSNAYNCNDIKQSILEMFWILSQ